MELIIIGILGWIAVGRKPKAKQAKDKPLRVVGSSKFVRKDGTVVCSPVYGR